MVKLKKKYEHVIQLFENDCGTAVVVNILKHNGYYVNYVKIKEILNNSIVGTNVREIKNFFNYCGVDCKLYKIPDNNRANILRSISNENLPCIVMLNKKSGNHYIVLYEINNKGEWLISDPSRSKLKKFN